MQRPLIATLVLLALICPACSRPAATLSSWNDTPTRDAIVAFVDRVTDEASPDYVPPAERIAVFDNDGTLWCEQPAYFQLLFALDRVKAMAPDHPEWRTTEPYRSVLAGDHQALAAQGEKALLEIVAATHAGMTTDAFTDLARRWVTTAEHPTLKRPYIQCIYQPQVELLAYLRAHGFKTFIVSGGGIDFMRPWTEAAYGIPPEQVVGSSAKSKYEVRDGRGVVVKQPQINFIDDKDGKPVGIVEYIGRHPILAVGNSDGDFQMLEYTTTNGKPRLGVLIHHDDADREFAYDRDSHIGRLARGLDEAARRGWLVVSMKRDWKTVFPESAE